MQKIVGLVYAYIIRVMKRIDMKTRAALTICVSNTKKIKIQQETREDNQPSGKTAFTEFSFG